MCISLEIFDDKKISLKVNLSRAYGCRVLRDINPIFKQKNNGPAANGLSFDHAAG